MNYFHKKQKKFGFTVTDAIIKEHKEIARTTEYVGRAITSFKRLNGINFREIFEDVKASPKTASLDKVFLLKEKLFFWRYGIRLKRVYNANDPI